MDDKILFIRPCVHPHAYAMSDTSGFILRAVSMYQTERYLTGRLFRYASVIRRIMILVSICISVYLMRHPVHSRRRGACSFAFHNAPLSSVLLQIRLIWRYLPGPSERKTMLISTHQSKMDRSKSIVHCLEVPRTHSANVSLLQ